jgi:hypothetical protein
MRVIQRGKGFLCGKDRRKVAEKNNFAAIENKPSAQTRLEEG